jgi:hypothetical protein
VSTPDRDKVHLRAERLMAAWAEQKIVREADSQRFLVGFDLLAFSGNRSRAFAAKSHFF